MMIVTFQIIREGSVDVGRDDFVGVFGFELAVEVTGAHHLFCLL